MHAADVRLVIGTRPEAIKLAPLADALERRGLSASLILTGQHPSLEPADFGLAHLSAVRLGCPGRADPHEHARSVADAMRPHLSDRPRLLVVHGDTSSAFGAASAGFAAAIPVAHVEAGLRTFDPQLPWPEEGYRTAIDAQAQLLFAPTATSAENLRSERVRGAVHVTGNTGIDAALALEARLPAATLRETALPQVLVTCHRRESWGEGIRSVAQAIIALCAEAKLLVLLHPNPHVRAQMTERLCGVANVELVEPVDHATLLRLVRDSALVLSDSGGIQEEAPVLGTPLLVLREKTERPEGVACGSAVLVGTSTDRIIAEARRLLRDPVARAAMSRRAFPYGDGRAAPRIAAIIHDWLAHHGTQSGVAA